MAEKTVALKYTLAKEQAVSAYELSGEKKQRFERNRNTTICFAVIIVLFLINIVTALTKNSESNSDYLIYTSIIFIAISVVMIAVTWLGGRSVINNGIKAVSDGTEYKVFINENGISYIFGNAEEIALSRGNYSIKANDEIYLLTAQNQKLIIPKSAVSDEDAEAVRKYLL